MKKGTFSTQYLTDISELQNELDWDKFSIQTPTTTISSKDFTLVAVGTPNLAEEKWEMDIKNPQYNTREDLVYALVVEGKIFKFGKSITTMQKRIQSYHCGKDAYRKKENATNSASNWYVLQSVLHMGKPVYIYVMYIPKTENTFKGWVYPNRVSKEIEGLLIAAFVKKYGNKPIGNRQS